jgi:hypothetical protein
LIILPAAIKARITAIAIAALRLKRPSDPCPLCTSECGSVLFVSLPQIETGQSLPETDVSDTKISWESSSKLDDE